MKTNENRDKSLEKMNIKEEDVIRETLVTKAKESIRDVFKDMLYDRDLKYMEKLAKYKDDNLIKEIKNNKELFENISDKLKENGSNVNIEDLGKELKEELNNVTVETLLEQEDEVGLYNNILDESIENNYNKEISDKLEENFKNCIRIWVNDNQEGTEDEYLERYEYEITEYMLVGALEENLSQIEKSSIGMGIYVDTLDLKDENGNYKGYGAKFDKWGEVEFGEYIAEMYPEIDINKFALEKCKEYTKEDIKDLLYLEECKNYTKEDISYSDKDEILDDLKDKMKEEIEVPEKFIYEFIYNDLNVKKIENLIDEVLDEILFENKTFVQIEKGDKESNNNLYNYLYNETEMRKDEIVEKFRNNDIYADKDGKMIVNIKGEDGEITGAYQIDITKSDKEIKLLDNSKEKSEEVENFINNKVLGIEENQEQTEEIEEEFEIE